MIAKSLELVHFRNYANVKIDLIPSLNVFIGKNGQGKTNLLEALYFMSVGESFRSFHRRELIKWDQDMFRTKASFFSDESERLLPLEMAYHQDGQSKIRLNGVCYDRMSQLPERLSSVLFTPDDLAIIKGSPQSRRKFLDAELINIDPLAGDFLRKYKKALQQRNELLKEVKFKRAEKNLLDSWNDVIAKLGSEVIYARISLLRQLVPRARRIHAYMTRDIGRFDITYHASLGNHVLENNKEKIYHSLKETLVKNMDYDIKSGSTSVGPHRDDLIFYEGGMDLRIFGSQGQQRTAILSLKLAEIEAFSRKTGRLPLLLLDDVLSELDKRRQSLLISAILKKKIQTIITATHFNNPLATNDVCRIFNVYEGKISINR